MKKLVIAMVLMFSAACGSKGGGGKIGVKECDDYISKLDACAAKVGGKDGESMKKMASMMREAWGKDAKSSATKASLAQTCEMASEDLAEQLPAACQ